jgi:hypothetical protein
MNMGDCADLAPTPPEKDWGQDPDLRFASWASKEGKG